MEDESAGRTYEEPATTRGGGGGRLFLWVAVAVLLAFGVGFGWQWWEARQVRDELATVTEERDQLQRRLELQRLGNTLGSAVLQSSYGNYEPARQAASEFFSGLQGIVLGGGGDGRLRPILDQRDQVITALSRSESRSRDLLSAIYVDFQRATGGSTVGVEGTSATGEPGEGIEGGAAGDTATPGSPVGPPVGDPHR